MRKRIFWVVLLLGIAVALSGSLKEKVFTFRHLGVEHGLSANGVLTIFQDSKGFIWAGTYTGLNKYDGIRFTPYDTRGGAANEPAHDVVYNLCEDGEGNLWIGKVRGGVSCLNLETGAIKTYVHVPGNPGGLSENLVNGICADDRGIVWIATEGGGLNRLDPKTGGFQHFRHHPGQPRGLPHDIVSTVFLDKKGTVWCCTREGGISKLDRDTGTFSNYFHTPEASRPGTPFSIKVVFEDSGGLFWMGTWGAGLWSFEPGTGKTRRYFNKEEVPNRMAVFNINAICPDQKKRLWIGTNLGLAILDKKTGTITWLHHDPNNRWSISDDVIRSVYRDAGGMMWVGTWNGGISIYDPNRVHFEYYTSKKYGGFGLKGKNIMDMCEDREGNLWLATRVEGLAKFNRETNRFVHYRYDPSNPRGIPSNQLVEVLEDSRGMIWCGTMYRGLASFDPEKGTFKHYPLDIEARPAGNANNINYMTRSETDILWVCTMKGLVRFDARSGAATHFDSSGGNLGGPGSDYISFVLPERTGKIWAGAPGKGLIHFDPLTGITERFLSNPGVPGSLSDHRVCCIYRDGKGILWVGTFAGGLNRFDPQNKTFIHYTRRDGLISNEVLGITEDTRGYLWLSTERGITRFHPVKLRVKHFDINYNHQVYNINYGVIFKGIKGEIFYGGSNGFNIFYPGEVENNTHIPDVRFTAFNLLTGDDTGKTVPPAGPGIFDKGRITLPYSAAFFSLEFAALDYSEPSRNRYRYRLEGLREEWTGLGNKNEVTFLGLEPGEYTLRVKGSNNDGVWNQTGVALDIVITPPFWGTWWFKLSTLLVFAVLSYLSINYSKKYLVLLAFWRKKQYVGHYRLIEAIGSGGMGTVFKAEHLLDKSRPVALKVLRDEVSGNDAHRRRFINEAVTIDQISHPNIVKIYERGEHNRQLYIAMEYLDGVNLGEKIKKHHPIPLDQCLTIALQLARALEKIHEKGIIHRDLKPENVMLLERPGTPISVKLLDFGLARLNFQSRITETGVLMGTIHYMPPEQFRRGEMTFTHDIYSLGVLFYEMVTGERPFLGETQHGILVKILEALPPSPRVYRPALPKPFEDLILSMMAKRPRDRPAIEDILSRLDKLL